ncbi:family 47 glycoside hydrolase [Cryphonectria parasitica EP155]|uniref:alpha-1,2-Mannosidase n=1 Tax=Cryphonectria parasitica (strain ATCC 38755 / EP155) TaxID=660469 RepID=A0A9P4Y5K5_CRYP1|nr:family 47 glycoside hydrolase [Cryphonectria parasitica EP155]KAF3766958.1 family 47 glycoside hydrolase [Cryphonectria parasitica EP155]
MISLSRRRHGLFIGVALIVTLYLLFIWNGGDASSTYHGWQLREDYFWKTVTVHYPPASIRPLPTERPVSFPRVQATKFPQATTQQRQEHRQAVKDVFSKCWASYRTKAWLADELTPVSGSSRNPFGAWGATLVDSLDTLWIMGMKDEFSEAVAAAMSIDFTVSKLDQINTFETTIRYLGGFLAAYDLSGDVRLLRKAVEVGEMLYKAFDTPNRMPITRWYVNRAAQGERQVADEQVLIAEIGSLTMEFTRLSLLTGDAKWFDAVQRIADLMAAQQDKTELAGLWPLVANAKEKKFAEGSHFTLAAMADSTFEYLPKMAALLGGTLPAYQNMYEKAMDTATQYLLFRPITPTSADILMAGTAHTETQNRKTAVTVEYEGQHLTCYVGGMYALGGRLFGREADVDVAAKLTEGCVWAYGNTRHGVMPEKFRMAACANKDECPWDDLTWKKQVVIDAGETITREFDKDINKADSIIAEKRLSRGFTAVTDARYLLRPEAIESVFVLYRVTGREDLLGAAWAMFTAIDRLTSTELANSAVNDVTAPGKPIASDSMESFWMGETLKYFYLIFSEESMLSLDDWVFNTEAHPFRRLKT